MSGGANKRREVRKFEGDDINEYMDGCVNGVTHNESEGRMERHDRQPGGIRTKRDALNEIAGAGWGVAITIGHTF
eukprot:COSAG02_NODE_2174_length_9589_cov_49.732561_9_plen_75_part_00